MLGAITNRVELRSTDSREPALSEVEGAAVPILDLTTGFARLLLINLSSFPSPEFPGFPAPPEKQPNRYSCHYRS